MINTLYLKKIGTDQNLLESFLSKNKQLKKYAKMVTYYKGMKMIEKAAFGATYKTVWCAGSSIEFTKKVEPIQEIITRFKNEFEISKENLNKVVG